MRIEGSRTGSRAGFRWRRFSAIWRREGGTNRGKGGVMRVVYPELGVLGESGTLGGCFPIASGAGLSIKVKGGDQAVLCFFGDGTSNRGTFHESMNFCA